MLPTSDRGTQRLSILATGLLVLLFAGLLLVRRESPSGHSRTAAPEVQAVVAPEAPAPSSPAVRAERPKPEPHAPPAPDKTAARVAELDKLASPIAVSGGSGPDRFVLRDKNVSAFFTDSGVTLAILRRRGGDQEGPGGHVLKWGLAGAEAVKPKPTGELPTRINRYKGDPSTWQSNLPTYSQVVYEQVKPGVDLIVESRPHALKYTLQVRAGAEPGELMFRYEGADNIDVAADGTEVTIMTQLGPVFEKELRCWQDGPAGRSAVSARYVKSGEDAVLIDLGEYDPSLPLTIDPVVGWATFLGGSMYSGGGEDYGRGIAADINDNVYVGGYTYSVNFPTQGAGVDTTMSVNPDAFVAKYSSPLAVPPSALLWSTFLGGNSSETLTGLRIDSSANVYVTGYTNSTDYPMAGTPVQPAPNFGTEIFVTKLNGTNAALIYSTYLGGNSSDLAQAIAVDAAGNAYITGYTYSTNFPTAGTPYRSTPVGTPDVFVSKLNATGSSLVWSTYIGGTSTDVGQGIAVDTSSPPNVYITGYTNKTASPATDWPIVAGSYDTTHAGLYDTFVTKIAGSGSSLVWSTFLGGTSYDYCRGIAVDPGLASPNVYVVGYTQKTASALTDFPTVAGSFDTTHNGGYDVFVSKLNAAGNSLLLSTFMGGTSTDYGQAIAVDPAATVYVTGTTYSTGFPVTVGPPSFDTNHNGGGDVFVSRLVSTFAGFNYSTFIGGSSTDEGYAIAERASWCWVTGNTSSFNYPASTGDLSLGGFQDAFVSAFNVTQGGANSHLFSTYLGGTNGQSWGSGRAVAVGPLGSVFVAGMTDAIDFPTTSGAWNEFSNGWVDVTVTKLPSDGTAPALWSTYLGGTSDEYVQAIALGPNAEVFVTGVTYSFDYPKTAGSYTSPLSGNEDIFITKLKNDGADLEYSFPFGGTNDDQGYGIAVDNQSGFVYLVGTTYSADFPLVNEFDNIFLGGGEAWVAKVNPTGSNLSWSSYLGGDSSGERGLGIALGANGSEALIAGITYSSDFFTTTGPGFDFSSNESPFIVKLSTGSPGIIWSTFFGGSSVEWPAAIVVDSTNFVYAAGYTYSGDFPAIGGFQPFPMGGSDGFVIKFRPDGNQQWGTYLGGSSYEEIWALAVDANFNVYVSGYTQSTDLPTTLGVLDAAYNGGSSDAFAARINADASTLGWITYIGGAQNDWGWGLALSSQGHVYVVGETRSPDFPATGGAFDTTLNGSTDMFVMRISNEAPSTPGSLAQYRTNGTTSIITGGATNELAVILKGIATDVEEDGYTLQIEIRPVGSTFVSPAILVPNGQEYFESGVFPSSVTASVTVNNRQPGTLYHWQARAVDTNGVASNWMPYGSNFEPNDPDFQVDQVLPTISITTPPNSGTYYTASSTLATLGGPAFDAVQVSGVTWANAGTGVGPVAATWNSGTGTWQATNITLQVGSNVITATVTDIAGNTQNAVLNVIRDNLPPVVNITNPTSGTSYVTNVSPLTGASPGGRRLEGNSSDNIAVSLAEYRVNGNPIWTTTTAVSPPSTANWFVSSIDLNVGVNTIDVRVTDLAGTVTTDTITVTYDPTPPVLSFVTPPGPIHYTNQASQTLIGNVSDAVTSISLMNWQNTTTSQAAGFLPSQPNPPNNWTANLIPLTFGANNINIIAWDVPNNSTTINMTVHRDTTNPTVAITSPAATPTFITNQSSITLSGTANDPNLGFGQAGLLDITWANSATGGGATLAGASPWNAGSVTLNAGTNTITVTVRDRALNTGTAQIVVTYDPTQPSVTISQPNTDPAYTQNPDVPFSGSSSDNISVQIVEWKLNSGTYAPTSGTTGSWNVPAGSFVLADGTNTLFARATDTAGNQFVKSTVVIRDNTPPSVAITTPSSSPHYTQTSSLPLAGTASDTSGITLVEWRNVTTLPGSWFPVSSGTTSWTITGITLVDGPNTIEVRAKDSANNTQTATLTAIRDNAAPTVTIGNNGGNNFPTNLTPLLLTGTYSDVNPIVTLEWSNGGGFTSVTPVTPWNISIPLAAGANNIVVRAHDGAGNIGTDTITVTYETTPPTVTITSPTSGTTHVTKDTPLSPTLSGTASDVSGITQVAWRIVPNPFTVIPGATTTWSVTTVNLAVGPNVIEVQATDGAGNTAIDTLTVTRDITPPAVAITAPSSNPTLNTQSSTTAFSGTVTDSGGAVVQSVTWSTTGAVAPNSGTASFGGGTWTIAPATIALADGVQTITVTATDSVGNVSTDFITITRDNTKPTLTIISPSNGHVRNTTPCPFVISASDTQTGVGSVSWFNSTTGGSGGATFGGVNWNASVPLTLGANSISVTCTDGAGNTSNQTIITVTLDQTAPAVAIGTPSSNSTFATQAGSISFAGTVTDSGGGAVATVTWSTTGAVPTTSGPASFGGGTWTIAPATITLADGSQVITVTATDTAGNVSTDTITVIKDNGVPTVSFVTSSHVRNTTPVTVTISASDALSGVSSVTWGNTTTGASGPATFGGVNWTASISLQLGANTITAFSTDGAGNSCPTVSITITLDQTPPAVAITGPVATDTYATQGTTFSPTGTVSDLGGGVVQTMTWSTTGAVATTTGPVSFSGGTWSLLTPIDLANGSQVITITATDSAGNIATDTITVTKDTTPPAIQITSPTSTNTTPAAPFISGSSPKSFGGTASDTGGAGIWKIDWVNVVTPGPAGGSSGTINPATASWSVSIALAPTPDLNTITFTLFDNAGNTSTDTIHVSFDATAPTVNINMPTTAATFNTGTSPITIGGTATDNGVVTQVRWSFNGVAPWTTIFSGPSASSVAWSSAPIALSQGVNVIVVEATDDSTFTGTDTITIVYDSVAPTVAILTNGGANFATNVTPIFLNGTASDAAPSSALTSVTWGNAATSGSGNATGLGTWSASVPLTPGANLITITARDAANNASSGATGQITITYDPTPPVIDITTPTSAPSYDTAASSISLGGTVSDAVGIVNVSWSNPGGAGPLSGTVAPSAGAWTVPTINLSAGSQVITVTALDTAGNTHTDQITVFYDNAIPTVTIQTPSAGGTYLTRFSTVVLGGIASDNRALSAVNWSNAATGGSGTASGTASWTAQGIALSAGDNTITVTSVDALNQMSADAIIVVTYDPTLPSITITNPTPTPSWDTNLAAITLTGIMSDNLAIANVTWANAANGAAGTATLGAGTWTTDAPTISLANGDNLITITATDTAGNTSTDTITIFKDASLPTVTITNPTVNPTYLAGATPLVISGTATDNLPIVLVSWTNDAGGGTSGTAGGLNAWSASIDLIAGLNTITITATDSAGNQGSAVLAVTYDSADPTIVIGTNGGNNLAINTSPIFLSGTATDTLPGTVFSVGWSNAATGGSGTATGTDSWSASVPLAIGANLLTVTVTDNAGNTSIDTITVTLDTTVPTVTITVPTSATTHSTALDQLSLSGSMSDNIGIQSVGWSNAANGLSGGTSLGAGWTTLTTVDLVAGANVITITATDTAGNSSTDVITVTRDNAAPSVSIAYPPTPFITNNATLPMSGTATDNVALASVTWANSLGGSGAVTGLGSWTASVPLFAGLNTITITATDTSNNIGTAQVQVTYDGTAPFVDIDTNLGNPFATNAGPVALTGDASDAGGLASVTWTNSATGGIGAAAVGATWSASVPLANGVNNIVLTATDNAGNTATASISITFDAIVPAIAITTPVATPNHITSALTITLGGTMSDNVGVASVTWANAANSTNGATTTPLPGTWATSTAINLVEGENPITVTVTDTAGNTNTDLITVRRDTAPPAVAFTAPTTGAPFLTNALTLPIAGTASDNVAVAGVTWSNSAGGSGAASTTTSFAAWSASVPLVAGPQTITVTATDTAGNPTPIVLTVTQDPTPPTVTPAGPASFSTGSSSVNLSGTADDPGGTLSSVTWSNSGTGGSGTASGTTDWSAVIPLTPGTNIITITVTDAAGNTTTSTITVIHDTQAPTILITDPTSSATYNSLGTPTVIGGSATDNVGVTSITWSNTATGGSGSTPVADPWSVSIPLVEGSNQITVTASDEVGNTSTDVITITFDPTLPTVTITGPTSAATYSTTVSPLQISGTAADNLSLQEVTWVNLANLASGTAIGTTAWTATVPLASGSNTIVVTAIDEIGNAFSDQIVVTYDVVLPVVVISSPAPDVNTQTNPEAFTGTATDNIAVTNMTWTNSFSGASGPVTYTGPGWSASISLIPGANTITIKAFDALGNVGTASITVNYTQETVVPVITIDTPSPPPTYTSPEQLVTIGGTASDNVGVTSVTWRNATTRVTGIAEGIANWSAQVPLANGANVLQFTAWDAVGNFVTAIITVTYTAPLDTTAPTVTITAPTSADTFDTTVSPLYLECDAVDDVGIVAIQFTNQGTYGDGIGGWGSIWYASIPLVAGANVITITAIDPAGNFATDTITVNYNPPSGDPIPPQVSITTPGGGTVDVTVPTVDVAGISSDNNQVAAVTIRNATTLNYFTATGTTSWTQSSIALVPGVNVLEARAFDPAGNSTTSTLVVVYTPPAAAAPVAPVIPAGAFCGCLGLEVLLPVIVVGLWRRRRKL